MKAEEGCDCVNCRLTRIEAKLDKALTPDRAVILKAVESAISGLDKSEHMTDAMFARVIVDEIMEAF